MSDTTTILGFTTGTATLPVMKEFPIGAKLRFTIGYNEEWVKENNPSNSLAICKDTTRIFFGTKCIGGPAVTEFEDAVAEGYEGTFADWVATLATEREATEIDKINSTLDGLTLSTEGDLYSSFKITLTNDHGESVATIPGLQLYKENDGQASINAETHITKGGNSINVEDGSAYIEASGTMIDVSSSGVDVDGYVTFNNTISVPSLADIEADGTPLDTIISSKQDKLKYYSEDTTSVSASISSDVYIASLEVYNGTKIDGGLTVGYWKNVHSLGDKETLQDAIDGKQDTLVSGTNIKTINGNSVLGSGNIEIQGGTTDAYTKAETDELLAKKEDSLTLYSESDNVAKIDGTLDLKDADVEVAFSDIVDDGTTLDTALASKQEALSFYSEDKETHQASIDTIGSFEITCNIANYNGSEIATQDDISSVSGQVSDLALQVNDKVDEAPTDGKKYARQSGAWAEVTSGSSASVSGTTLILA